MGCLHLIGVHREIYKNSAVIVLVQFIPENMELKWKRSWLKCLWNEIFDFDFFGDSDSFWGLEYDEHICFWLQQLEVPFISLQKLRFYAKRRPEKRGQNCVCDVTG